MDGKEIGVVEYFCPLTVYVYTYLFVCSELIDETGRFPIVIFGI